MIKLEQQYFSLKQRIAIANPKLSEREVIRLAQAEFSKLLQGTPSVPPAKTDDTRQRGERYESLKAAIEKQNSRLSPRKIIQMAQKMFVNGGKLQSLAPGIRQDSAGSTVRCPTPGCGTTFIGGSPGARIECPSCRNLFAA